MKELTCTFFGHRKELPEGLYEIVERTVMELIQEYGVSKFYVGNQGKFDWLIAQVLQKLQNTYPHIKAEIVLAYLPLKQEETQRETLPTLYPEEIAKSPKRYAICKRNDWMIKQSDFVVCYVEYVGGAKQFMEKAIRQKRRVINLAEKVKKPHS